MIEFPLDYEERATRRYCSIAAAILGGGALTAGASIFGANKAAGAQTSAANNSIAMLQKMFGISQDNLQPFINAGQGGISNLQSILDPSGPILKALTSLVTPGADQSAVLSQTPGYQFAENQGLRAVNNQLAARGLGGSGGAVAKGAASFTTGLASNTWQSVVQALQNLFTSSSGAAQNLVNTGSNAAGTLAGAANTAGGNISNSLLGIGNAQGGAATATGNAIGGLGSSLSTAAILQKLLGNSGATNATPQSGVYGINAGEYNPNVPGGFNGYA